MLAITHHQYGPPEVLKLTECPKPLPKSQEVLIKIFNTTVTAGDCELRGFSLPFSIWWLPVRLYMGVFKPRFKILGQELAGMVEAVGDEVTHLKVGDRVVAATSMKLGAYAENICLPADKAITKIPMELSYQEAATIPTGGLNGLHFVNKSNLQSGEKLLIIGAGGSIGTYALQIAKLLGAVITCIDSHDKLDMLKAAGADRVIDFNKQDFSDLDDKYDVIIEIAGKSSYFKCADKLTPAGRLIIGNPEFTWMVLGMFFRLFTRKKIINALAAYRIEDMDHLVKLITEKKIRPVIDKSYKLEQMPEAHRYVEEGRKRGNLVIEVATEH